MRRIALAIVLVLALSASAAAAPSKTTVVKTAYNKDLKATILVGAGGLTLYLTTADSTSHNSVCTPDPSCRALWPPLKPPATAGAGVKSAWLGTTADGKQVTYKHHPLYYWAGPPPDKKPGQDGGQNYFQVWFAVSPKGAAVK
jgi:predicted lipoprotein with Yx(FWY)xxD motif